MLTSAGFITGTRTATVPQAQSSAAHSAKTWFFMIDFPGVPGQMGTAIGSTAVEAGSTSLYAWGKVAACGEPPVAASRTRAPRGRTLQMPQFLTLATILALAPAVLAQTQGSPTLAIAEVTARGKADADSATDMADALTEALVADGRVRVVERQQIAKVMKEQALSQAGVISDEVQIKVAQLVGARWIVLGTIGTKGKGYVLSLRALDSSSAQVAFADSVKVGTDEQIEAGSRQLARKLTGKLLGGTAQASNEVVGDFDPAQIPDGAKAVARSLALRFPKLTGRIVNVIPNGTASCTFSEAKPFKGEFFQISGADEVTGQDTSK